MEGLSTVASGLLVLALVAVAIVLSLTQRLGIEKDLGVAVVRSFVQLAAIGYVIDFIFALKGLGYVLLLLAVMIGFAGWTSSQRSTGVPGALPLAMGAVGLAALCTLGMLLALGVIPPTPRYLILLGGMVVGNSMNATSLTLVRLRNDVREQRQKVEAALSLGAPGRVALSPIVKISLRSALIPLIDSNKTAGIVLPGAMAGMITGGADPLEARLQMVVLYMLLGSVSIAALPVGLLSYRSFFNARHQLRP